MDIRQLKLFVAVAETQNFSKASEKCFISQSAISQQIKQLEDEVGVTLFFRNTHSVRLTTDGESFLPYALDVVKAYDTCRNFAKELDGNIHGQLNIGVGSFIEPYIRMAAVKMQKKYPDITLNITVQKASQLNRMLREHEIDIAFTMNLAKENEGIESMKAIQFYLCAIMRKDHKLAKQDKVTFEQLIKTRVIVPDVGSREMETIRSYYNVPTELLNTRIIVNDANSALNMTQELGYITFLPCMYVKQFPNLCAKPIEGLEMPLYSNAHWLNSVAHKRAERIFIDLVEESNAEVLRNCAISKLISNK